MKQPIFVAHRGAWKSGRKENTAAAIERAASSGRFAYIEFDVRRTRANDEGEQVPILIHDETLDRLYDLNRVPKYKRNRKGQAVYELTIDIIRGEDVEISTLQEAMRAANGNPLDIEIKTEKGLEVTLEVVSDMISKYDDWSWEKIVISSRNWSILAEAKKRVPEVGVAMIYTFVNLPRNFGRTYHNLGARFLKFNKWLAPVLLPLAALLGVPNRAVYTVNNRFIVRSMQLLGATIILTDELTLPDSFPTQS